MTRPLTAREQDCLDAIIESIRTTGMPPTVRELGAKFGVLSTSTVHSWLAGLKRKGYLTVEPNKPRRMTVVGLHEPGRAELELVRQAIENGMRKRALLEYIDSFLAA